MNSQPRRRLRRRSTDNDIDTTVDFPTRLPTPPTAALEIEQNPPNTSKQLPINLPTSTIVKLNLDRIRTELLDDFHHQNFSESDYWDESHNWSDDEDSVSDEYWHFLGQVPCLEKAGLA